MDSDINVIEGKVNRANRYTAKNGNEYVNLTIGFVELDGQSLVVLPSEGSRVRAEYRVEFQPDFANRGAYKPVLRVLSVAAANGNDKK